MNFIYYAVGKERYSVNANHMTIVCFQGANTYLEWSKQACIYTMYYYHTALWFCRIIKYDEASMIRRSNNLETYNPAF